MDTLYHHIMILHWHSFAKEVKNNKPPTTKTYVQRLYMFNLSVVCLLGRHCANLPAKRISHGFAIRVINLRGSYIYIYLSCSFMFAFIRTFGKCDIDSSIFHWASTIGAQNGGSPHEIFHRHPSTVSFPNPNQPEKVTINATKMIKTRFFAALNHASPNSWISSSHHRITMQHTSSISNTSRVVSSMGSMPQRFNLGTAQMPSTSSTHRSGRGSVFEAAKVGAPEETRFLKGTFRLQRLV